MKIVYWRYTLNPDDLSWEALEAMGECEIYDRTSPELVVERAKDAEVVMTNKTVLHRGVIERLPKLRYIGELATGFNNIDLHAARERDIAVTNIPTYATPTVAQMTFAHLLTLSTRGRARRNRTRREMALARPLLLDFPLLELSGLRWPVGLGAMAVPPHVWPPLA